MKTHRVLKILMIFKGRRYPYERINLAHYFNVSNRTIDRDMRTIEGAGIEVIRSYRHNGVCYFVGQVDGEYLL